MKQTATFSEPTCTSPVSTSTTTMSVRGSCGFSPAVCKWSRHRAFLTKLKKVEETYGVDRIAFVLMPNHFHFVMTQLPGGSLARMMNALETSHAKRYNLRHHHTGHVFEGRYQYTHIPSEEALLNVACYVHLNPVRAGLVARPEDWEFSDFAEILGRGVLHQRTRPDEGRLEHGLGHGGLDTMKYVQLIREAALNLETIRRLLFQSAAEPMSRRPSSKNTPRRRTP